MTTNLPVSTPPDIIGVPKEASPATQPLLEQPLIRFLVTLASNGLRAGISFVTGLMVARGLGAAQYGNLTFLLGSFTAVNAILDAGSTFAFYTLLAQRRRGWRFFVIYFIWTFGVQFGGTLLVVGLLTPAAVIKAIWLGHDRSLVLLALTASFMISQSWNAVSQMGEAARKTVVVQIAGTLQGIAHLALIALAAWRHWLSVTMVLTFLAIEYFLIALSFGPRLLKANLDHDDSDPIREILSHFIAYCRPLVIYGSVSFAYLFADRWLLQRFGGARQQGYFSIGQQFSNLCALAALSVLNVFWKEVAAAQSGRDHERVRQIYLNVKRVLYFSAAWLSCLLIPYTRLILKWTLGAEYEAAWLPLSLLFLYPIHQSLGQIQGTFWLATGDTKRYTLAGIVFMAVSIPVSYLMLAPATASIPGLGLGAAGVALKMVIMQIAGIAFHTVLLQRSHKLGYDFGYQAAVIASLLGISWVSKEVVGHAFDLLHLAASSVPAVIVAVALYGLVTLAFVWRAPSIAGVSAAQLAMVRSRVFRFRESGR